VKHLHHRVEESGKEVHACGRSGHPRHNSPRPW
jgi:hypothetical protein